MLDFKSALEIWSTKRFEEVLCYLTGISYDTNSEVLLIRYHFLSSQLTFLSTWTTILLPDSIRKYLAFLHCERLLSGSVMLHLRKHIRTYLLPPCLLSTGEHGSLYLWCNDFFWMLSFEHVVIPSYWYGFFLCSHRCMGDGQKQGTEFEGQMRTAGDGKGAGEGRDVI